jgi:hypothetical protein
MNEDKDQTTSVNEDKDQTVNEDKDQATMNE